MVLKTGYERVIRPALSIRTNLLYPTPNNSPRTDMKINLILGIVIFFGLAIFCIGENNPAFMGTGSLLTLAGGALSFGISASGTFSRFTTCGCLRRGSNKRLVGVYYWCCTNTGNTNDNRKYLAQQ